MVCKVRITKKVTEPFKVTTGLRHGNTLSPGLFNLAFELKIKIMDETRLMELNRSPILAFVDDIAILGGFQEEVIETTEKLIRTVEKMALIISEENTKYIKVSRQENNPDGIINNIKIN